MSTNSNTSYVFQNKYKKMRLLGSGTFGNVYLVQDINTNKSYNI